MFACTCCEKITYCSRDCQKAHWSTHKQTCVAPADQKPVITTVCTALYHTLPPCYAPEEMTEFDTAVAQLLYKAEVMEQPYRFVARAVICLDWVAGDLHIGDRTVIPTAKAIRAGRWIFALEPDPCKPGEWLVTCFMGQMHGMILRLDALTENYTQAYVLMAWMVDELAPLLKVDPASLTPDFTNLDPIELYEFSV
jgi:hypothetical protein